MVARLISAGIKAARELGKEAARGRSKRAYRLLDEPTEGERQIEPAIKGSRAYDKGVVKGAGVGAGIGGAAALADKILSSREDKEDSKELFITGEELDEIEKKSKTNKRSGGQIKGWGKARRR